MMPFVTSQILSYLGEKEGSEHLVADLQAAAARLPDLIQSLAGQHREILSRMAALKRAGIIYAKPHYRQGKYLYLIYPMQDGVRRREYVGAALKGQS